MTYQAPHPGEVARQGFAALADPTRQTILGLLQTRVLTVGELAGKLTVSRPAVSQHMKVLKQANLVQEERAGTRHYFGLNASGFALLRTQIDSMWQSALNSFSAYVERQESVNKRPSRSQKRRESES